MPAPDLCPLLPVAALTTEEHAPSARKWWRYYFAGQLMAALLTAKEPRDVSTILARDDNPRTSDDVLAEWATTAADALLAKLESEEAGDA